LLDQTVKYLQDQAAGAKEMMSALDASEAAGFTAGINYHSREILLSAWRQVWGAAGKGVPGEKKARTPR